ncbi:MAG: phosphonate ABC transporter ATP-binding protein [Deltaproteobacteria bacterium]|nr:phosphonate ABC transporter ATP-binding protein [Deltaproteobacteria bacterium]
MARLIKSVQTIKTASSNHLPQELECRDFHLDLEDGKGTMNPAVDVRHVSKTFGKNQALHDVSLQIDQGEMVALIGASGSGKSTLLQNLIDLVSCDKQPSSIKVLGRTVQLNGESNCNIRKIRADIGFIFQQFNLVGRLPLLTNVLTGMLANVPVYRSMIRWFTYPERKHAMEALARVSMADYATQRASTLSGGQQQRGAIARALVQGAKIILADEPIASLDPASSTHVMETLRKINKEDGVTIIVSLHQVDYAMKYCERSIGLKKGKVVFDGPTEELSMPLLREIYGTEFGDIEEGVDIMSLIAGRHEARVKAKKEKDERSLQRSSSAFWRETRLGEV